MTSKKDVEFGFYTIRHKVALRRTSGLVKLPVEAMGGKNTCYPSIPKLIGSSNIDIPTTPNTSQHCKTVLKHKSLSRQPAYQDIAELLWRYGGSPVELSP